MPARCFSRGLGAFGAPDDFYQEPANYVETDPGIPTDTYFDSGYTDPCANGACVMDPGYGTTPTGTYEQSDWTTPNDYVTDPNANSGGSGGSSASSGSSTSDQFLSYLSQFGKDAANAALKYGIQYGTKAATDYVNCLAQGGNADRCAGIVQNAAKSGAQAVTRDALKAQIINLNNEIEKVKASLLSATTPEAKALLQSTLNSLQAALMTAIAQLAQMGEAPPIVPSSGQYPAVYPQQPGTGLAVAPGWLDKALLVPVGGVAAGAAAGWFYAKKPLHAVIGAGVGGVLGYLLTKVVGR
jgi:hypothetical protein